MEISTKEMEIPANSIAEYKVDASFRKIPKSAISFSIWKVDENRLEAVFKTQYGTFYDDGAYIIYASGLIGSYVNMNTITRETKPNIPLERYIHVWLGSNVSDLKRSNIAHKIQELDSYFGNVATEYRETQNNESGRFLSYFKKGLIIRSSIMENASQPDRLFRLQGRKYLRCTEMESISWEHFGADYVMLLKTDGHVYIWFGRSSSYIERRNAINLATKFQSSPTSITLLDDGYEQQLPDKHKAVWNTFLPLNSRVVKQSTAQPMELSNQKLRIYKCSYKAQRLHLDQLDVVIPTKDDLKDPTTTYVIDANAKGVWLWVGGEAPQMDGISAMGNGRAFVKKKKYPYSTPVIRVVAGHEPIEFIRLFPNWYCEGIDLSSNTKPVAAMCGKFDSQLLCQRPKMAADLQLVDDGTGERIIYKFTKDNKPIEIPSNKLVAFGTDHCYIVHYTVACYSTNSADVENIGIKNIVYQWNGSEANAANVAKCEIYAKDYFDKLNEKSMFVQMSEFDETPHFLQIFNGKLIILQSDESINHTISNITNNNNIDPISNLEHKQFVLKIHGDATYNSKAVEVYPLSTMSSKDCFVVKTNHIFVWCGQSATGDSREVAKSFGALLGECTLVMEGMEPKDFWDSLTNHANEPLLQKSSVCSSLDSSMSNGSDSKSLHSSGSTTHQSLAITAMKARTKSQLFLVWTQSDKFFCQEIIGYEQNDLSPEGIFILDTGLLTYVWLGELIQPEEKWNCLKTGQRYLETIPIARRPTTAIAIVKQNNEPNVFTGLFDNWNYAHWKSYDSFEQKRQAIAILTDITYINGMITNGNGKLNGNINGVNGTASTSSILNHQKYFDRHHKYPISVLQSETDQLPIEVNPIKREVHLTHDDFVSLFQMSYWEFIELPTWKQQELKKKNKIF